MLGVQKPIDLKLTQVNESRSMLQPREELCVNRKRQKVVRKADWNWAAKQPPLAIAVAIALLCCCGAFPLAFAQHIDDAYRVDPTPALQTVREDLTTVVLVNNDNGRSSFDFHGRHSNFRPEIGLLTSTARTFIQEGVTTEYATQVVGTTLDNGRVYAQYLKKSSRVLYDGPANPSVVTSWVGESTSLLQNHNDLLNADLPDWGDIDDRLQLQRNSFVGNTDYIGYNERLLSASSVARAEPGPAFVLATPVANEVANLASLPQEGGEAVAANKVLPAGDLPTYTVTNTFSPSGVSLDSVYSRKYPLAKSGASSSFSSSSSSSKDATRSPKVIYKQLLLSSGNIDRLNEFGNEYSGRSSVPAIPLFRSFSTVTYYGFAEFTTTVGDSVIVFSPSTSANAMPKGQVTSIKGEATLEVTATKSADFATVAPTKVAQSPVVTQVALEDTLPPTDPQRDSAAQTEAAIASEEPPVAVTVSQPESSADRPESMLSRPTGDEVLKIYSAIAKANANTATITPTTTSASTSTSTTSPSPGPSPLEVAASSTATEVPVTTTHGGATTIFFEDDPFENFLEPTEVLTPIATPSAERSIEATSEVLRSTAIASGVPEAPVEPTTEAPEAEDADPETTTMAAATTTADDEADETTDITTDAPGPPEADTTESAPAESVTADAEYTVREINADDEHDIDPNCIRTSQVFLTQLPKTITQLTTFLIANELAATSETSISTNLIPSFEISQATKHYCIQATATSALPQPVPTTATAAAAETTSTDGSTSSSGASATTEPTTEPPHLDAPKKTNEIDAEPAQEEVSEATPSTEEPIDSSEVGDGDEPEGDGDADDEAESGEEIELLYKTLYTTYTYLTTFFHEDTTSISSHTEVVTNVITSTLGAAGEAAGYEEGASSTEQFEIAPTKTDAGGAASSKFMVPQELESLIRDGETAEADADGDAAANQSADGVHLDASEQALTTTRTYFTTYTYYTTIFAEGETELMSRTEVYTNLVVDTTDIAPTKVVDGGATGVVAAASPAQSDDRPGDSVTLPSASDTQSRTTSLPDLSEYSQMLTLVTDVRSSSSTGEQQIINRSPIQGRQNDPNHIAQQQGPIDDQISSETNTGDINVDSIEPSATLLLQTSFTTFTYYTTMYNGDNTNVISRLETITNVVTETLQPTKASAGSANEDATLPITYYTTYTYWTKLAKDGDIQTISREETISNVVTPTAANQIDGATSAAIDPASPLAPVGSNSAANPDPIAVTSVLEPTTFYTTYTFYTTSYEVDKTITDSRFETVTNVVTPTVTLDNAPTSSSSPTDTPTSDPATPTAAEQPLLLYDYKKIIDADGVSTLHFTTQVSATLGADGSASQVVSSTSSLHIDEEKKSVLSTAAASSATAEPETVTEIGADGLPTVSTLSATPLSSRQYKTGLVRLIEGTRIANLTTTLYQSKVIGTFIDNRYAQIIESTSSFLFNTQATAVPLPSDGEAAISPSTVQASAIDVTASPTPNAGGGTQVSVVEGSIDNQEATTETAEIEGDDNEEEEEGEDGDDKARYPSQSRKRTFTPVIRPFASRGRPQFAPKKKAGSPSSATIITRSDFTPTITATPALKSNVVGSSRRGGLNSLSGSFGSSSSRRFGRPSSKLQSSGGASQTGSSPQGSSRSRLSNTARLSLGSSLRRASSSQIRPSSSNFRGGISSGFGGNSRLRIRPTGSFGFGAGQQTASGSDGLAAAPPAGDNSVEPGSKQTEADDGDEDSREESTTENSKLNSLNRFRRPPLNRPSGFVPAGGARPTAASGGFSLRRNPLTARAKATSAATTTTTTTTSRPRSFQRPTIGSFQNRARPQNSLFPPRGLFQASKNNTAQGEDTLKQGQSNDDDSDYDEEDEDEDAEGEEEGDDETNEDATKRRRRSEFRSSKKQPAQKANEVKRRVRREAEADTTSSQTRTNFRNRFRRPPKASQPAADVEEPTTDTPAPPTVRGRSRIGSRFGSSTSGATTTTAAAATSEGGHGRAIRPTRPSSGRAQFTLREKDSAAPRKGSALSFPRRPQASTAARRKTSGGSSSGVGGGSRRLKSFSSGGGANEAPARSASNGRGRTLSNVNGNGRNRASPRSRNNHLRNEYGSSDVGFAAFEGTITVTHVTPAEVTIPVVNGKITEYKNVVTAKTSTEVLGPKQYSTVTGSNGMATLVLTRHESSVNYAGATEVTQYVLHETPTTTVTFTPTTIRGRKTSFSHVIPSTVYSVEALVSTSQPQLAANAPLANILLSQLLLGNFGQPANPLVGGTAPPLGGVVQPPAPATPVTEYRTHTSTYVTTVVEGMSTVLPITFLGKKILTTVYDTTANTITATEFITDTIVTTPTQVQQQQQQPALNSLLLQQLLLQQQLQPQLLDPLQQPQPTLNSAPPQLQFLGDGLQDLDSNHIQHQSSEHIDSEDVPIVGETQTHKSGRKKSRKGSAGSGKRNKKHQNNNNSNNNNNNNRQRDEEESASVITLYVSGRRPGEFSTVLSTVQASGSVYKREAAKSSRVAGAGLRTAAATDGDRDVYETNGSEFVSEYLLPEGGDSASPFQVRLFESQLLDETNLVGGQRDSETQTLESIVGDVNLWYTVQVQRDSKSTKQSGRAASALAADPDVGVVIVPLPADTAIQPTSAHFFAATTTTGNTTGDTTTTTIRGDATTAESRRSKRAANVTSSPNLLARIKNIYHNNNNSNNNNTENPHRIAKLLVRRLPARDSAANDTAPPRKRVVVVRFKKRGESEGGAASETAEPVAETSTPGTTEAPEQAPPPPPPSIAPTPTEREVVSTAIAATVERQSTSRRTKASRKKKKKPKSRHRTPKLLAGQTATEGPPPVPVVRTRLHYETRNVTTFETSVRTRTYTYIIDRVNGDEHDEIKSTTTVRLQTQTVPIVSVATSTVSQLITEYPT